MDIDRLQFLNVTHQPGRLTAQEAAWYLGFAVHDVPILTKAALLHPLGSPTLNAVKFFLRAELDHLRDDRAWMGKACDAISEYWRLQNVKRPKSKAPRIGRQIVR